MDATTAATFRAIRRGDGMFRKAASGRWFVIGPATWSVGDVAFIAMRSGGQRRVSLDSKQTSTTPDGLDYGMYDYTDLDRPVWHTTSCDHDWDNRGVCNACGAKNPRYDAMA